MSKASMENEVRSRLFDIIIRALEAAGEQPLSVSTSEYTCPTVFSNGEEAFANIKISIPRGTRDGSGGLEPYDGYFAHDEWMEELASREEAERAKQEKKARAEAEKERKKSAKKVVKTMKDDLKEVLPSQVE